MYIPAIQPTADGSNTLVSAAIQGELYHSSFGAIQESKHIYIDEGFHKVRGHTIHVLEYGFGTGLNALLTMLEAEKVGATVFYETVELYPIPTDLAVQLNYSELLAGNTASYFAQLHACKWGEPVQLSARFTILKQQADISTYLPTHSNFDIVYFDAFAPEVQPQLWDKQVFHTIYTHMIHDGALVTYSSKGVVKENLRSAGFTVRRITGPKGKRHILRATKQTTHSNK